MNLDKNLGLGVRNVTVFDNFALTFAVDLHSDLDLTYIMVLIPINDIIYLKIN